MPLPVILQSTGKHFEVLLDDYEVHPFADPNGVPKKALLHMLLTYIEMHLKMILQRKETNRFGDKAILA
jgi:hypothetical protein